MNKKILIINPPDFSKYFYDKNIFCNDGLYVMNTLLKEEYPYIERKVIDFDFLNLGVLDVFNELKDYNPNFVYLNLNSYNCFSDFHLCLGIKKHCPSCKLIVGFNIADKIKRELNSEILESIDYWLDIDINLLKIDSDINSHLKIFERNKIYKNIYFYNKTKEEIIEELNKFVYQDFDRFIFRGTNDFSYEDILFIINKTKKHFKFILENDIIDIYQINQLYKKFNMQSVIIDLNVNSEKINELKNIKPFVFFRIKINNSNYDFYETLKQENLFFLDIVDNELILSDNFKKYRYKEFLKIYYNDKFLNNKSKNLFLLNPFQMNKFFKFLEIANKETKY